MRRWLVFLCLVLATACSGARPGDLAATTSYTLARTQGRFVTVGDLRIFAIVMGSGPDVVLVHGNPSNVYTWRKVIEPLAARYRVHAIDLPGYGFSDKPDDAGYTTDWLGRQVVGYLDVAGVERAVLVGSSMGGNVASETAILFPDRVAGLVLIGASGLSDTERPLSMRMLAWPVVGPALRSLPARGMVRKRMEAAVYDPSHITEADVDAMYAPLRSAGGTNAWLARMRHPVPPERAERVRTITAPTLVITGDSDLTVSPEESRRYHELIAGSELLVLAETRHLPQEEQPERTVQEITRLVEAAGSRGATPRAAARR